MHVAGIGAERLLQVGEERDDVVAGGGLDLVDALGRDVGARLDAPQRVHRDQAAAGVDLAHRQLHAEPRVVLRLLGPDPRHVRAGVAGNHRVSS